MPASSTPLLMATYADDAEVLVVCGMHDRTAGKAVVVAAAPKEPSAFVIRGSGRACVAVFVSAADALTLALGLAPEQAARVYVRTAGQAWAELVPVAIEGAVSRRKTNAGAGLRWFNPREAARRLGKDTAVKM
jgi:hypothetical protein